MATNADFSTLRGMGTAIGPRFSPASFQHPELIDPQALVWLDDIANAAGFTPVVTDDGRPPGDDPPSSAGSASLHHIGRAFDLRTRDLTAEQRFRLVQAVITVSAGRLIEIEIVVETSPHLHIGLFLPGALGSRLELRV